MSQVIDIKLIKEIDSSYQIAIGSGLLDNIGEKIVKLVSASLYVIITDTNVGPYHADKVKNSLEKQDVKTLVLTFNSGEINKVRKTKIELENKLLENNAARDSCIIALGGGVTGDLAGFVAATYQRGIPFIQVATTLLAQVDSSIGGKVAVDTSYAKNMIGAFYQPKAVFIDINTLNTLPEDIKLNGIGEVIKHSVIKDMEYFKFLEENSSKILNLEKDALIKTIYKSCIIKSRVVEEDETEKGVRKILNFGHTIGHAVETLMDYELIHDKCVCIGIYYEAKIARELGYISSEELERIKNLLLSFNVSIKIPDNLSINDIIKKTYLDKKVRKNKVEYSLPSGIGNAEFNIAVPEEIVKKVLSED